MTDRALIIESGEDRSPIEDITDRTVWEESEFGLRAWRGESTNSNVTLRDEDGTVGRTDGAGVRILPRNVWKLTHGSNVLFRGRLANYASTRGDQPADKAREYTFYLEDPNIDLRGIVVHGHVRPAETDVARMQAFIAQYLSGSPSATRNINGSNLVNAGSNTVTLAAKTYNQTTLDTVIAEIADEANKTYYVLPPVNTSTTQTGVMVYDGNDAVVSRCPYRITDRPSEVKASPNHYFHPIWNVGAAADFNGQESLSGVWLFYGADNSSYYHATKPVIANRRAWWEEVIFDDSVATAAEAERKAEAILSFRQFADRAVNVTIGPLGDEHIGSIKVGQTIGIKARAIPGAEDAFLDLKIGQLKFTTPAPGMWFVHLQLDRPWRMGPYGKGSPIGPKAPTSGTVATILDSVHAEGDSGGASVAGLDVLTSDSTLYAVWLTHDGVTSPTANYRPNPASSSGQQAMTLVHTETHSTPSSGGNTDNETIYVFRLENPTVATGSGIVFGGSGTQNGWAVGAWLVEGTAAATYFSNEGLGTSSSVTPTAGSNDLVLDAMGWRIWSLGDASNDPSPTASQSEDWGVAFNNAPGQPDMAWGGGHKSGSGARTWSWTTSTNWVAVAIVIAGAGTDTTQPVGETGEGSGGTNADVYAPIDHVHEHGSLTAASDYHDADQVSIDDAGGYFTGTNVEAALQELGLTGGSHDHDADYSPLGHVHSAGDEGLPIDGAYVYRTGTATNVADSTTVAVPLETEVFDTGGYWASGNPTRITITNEGWYEFWAETRMEGEASFSDGSFRLGRFQVNGGTDAADFFGDRWTRGINALTQGVGAHGFHYLEAGDYVEFTVQHNAGETLRVPWDGTAGTPTNYTRLLVQRVSSAGADTSMRWEAVTDGADVFVWEGDDLVHEWKEY